MSAPDPDEAVETAYGNLSRAALEPLRRTFDTSQVQRAIDTLDKLLSESEGQEGLRENLIQLHAMTAHVFDGAPVHFEPGYEDVSLPLLAEDIDLQLRDAINALERWRRLVAPLIKLAVDD